MRTVTLQGVPMAGAALQVQECSSALAALSHCNCMGTLTLPRAAFSSEQIFAWKGSQSTVWIFLCHCSTL